MNLFQSLLHSVQSHANRAGFELELRRRPRNLPYSVYKHLKDNLGVAAVVIHANDFFYDDNIRHTEHTQHPIRKTALHIVQPAEISDLGFDVRVSVETTVPSLANESSVILKRFKLRHVYKKLAHEIHLTRVVVRRPDNEDDVVYELEVELDAQQMIKNTSSILKTLRRLNKLCQVDGCLEPRDILTKKFDFPGSVPQWRPVTWQDLKWNGQFLTWDQTIMCAKMPAASQPVWIFYPASSPVVYYIFDSKPKCVYSLPSQCVYDVSFILEAVLSDDQQLLVVFDIPYYRNKWLTLTVERGNDVCERVKQHFKSEITHVLPWNDIKPVQWHVLSQAAPYNEPLLHGPYMGVRLEQVLEPGMVLTYDTDGWSGGFTKRSLRIYYPYHSITPVLTVLRHVRDDKTQQQGELYYCSRRHGYETAQHHIMHASHMDLPPLAVYNDLYSPVMPVKDEQLVEEGKSYKVCFDTNIIQDVGYELASSACLTQTAIEFARCPIDLNYKNLLWRVHLECELLRISQLLGGEWAAGSGFNAIHTLNAQQHSSDMILTVDCKSGTHRNLAALKNLPTYFLYSWPVMNNPLIYDDKQTNLLGQYRIYLISMETPNK
jgi:mRNA capping enzyme, beta chain